MAVGVKLGSIIDEIGTPDFFHAFFSTVAGNVEPAGWGTKFPILMKKLYNGQLEQPDAQLALQELEELARELTRFPPSNVIWDIEDLGKAPPWGGDIADTITALSNYFVTSTGRDLLATLREVFIELRDEGGVLTVVSY